MRPIRSTLLFAGLAAALLAANCGGKTAPALTTDEDKTAYALGLMLGKNAEPFHLTPEQIEHAAAGFADAAAGKTPAVELSTWAPKVNELAQKAQAEASKKPAVQTTK